MTRTPFFLVLLGVALCGALASCAPADPGITVKGDVFSASQIERGRAAYEQICAQCHGIDGQGQFPDAPLEPDVTGRIGAPPHNEMGHTWHHSDEMLIRTVTEGGFADLTRYYQMPSFKDTLTHTQIVQIIAYIKTMWTSEQRIEQRALTEEEERMVAETQ